MNGETNWLTPDLLKRARAVAKKEGGGRRTLMKVFHLTDHKARILADVLAGRAEMPAQKLSTLPANTLVKIPEHKSGRYRLGILADTHLGSTAQQISMLRQVYDIFDSEGVKQVFHLGDLTDGIGVYRGQIQEQWLRTMDDQVEYAVEEYPRRSGIKTSLIAGNHDLAATLSGGLDPMRALASRRDDIRYLGPLSAWVNVGPIELHMLHPRGGRGYALSYRLQKLIESYEGGRKPRVAACGHWHSACMIEERNVLGLLPGCLCAQTSYERGLMLNPSLGAVILDIEIREEEIAHITRPTFIKFFVPREKDY